MGSSNAQRVQGPGPNTGDGDPIDVNVLSSPAIGTVKVEGVTAEGDAFTENPVGVGGESPTGLKRAIVVSNGGIIALVESTVAGGDFSSNLGRLLDASGSSNILSQHPFLFNDTTFDRRRNNARTTLLSLASRAASTASAEQINFNHRRLAIYFRVTVLGAGNTLQPTVQWRDVVSGNFLTVWAATAPIAATGDFSYLLADGAANAGGGLWTEVCQSGLGGRNWRLNIVKTGGGGNDTYSAGCDRTGSG